MLCELPHRIFSCVGTLINGEGQCHRENTLSYNRTHWLHHITLSHLRPSPTYICIYIYIYIEREISIYTYIDRICSKLPPNCFKNQSISLENISITFCILFCSTFAHFWTQLGPPNLGEQMFVIDVGSWSQLGAMMAPGPHQEAPRMPPGSIVS